MSRTNNFDFLVLSFRSSPKGNCHSSKFATIPHLRNIATIEVQLNKRYEFNIFYSWIYSLISKIPPYAKKLQRCMKCMKYEGYRNGTKGLDNAHNPKVLGSSPSPATRT